MRKIALSYWITHYGDYGINRHTSKLPNLFCYLRIFGVCSFFVIILTVIPSPLAAKTQKIGDWKIYVSDEICSMDYDGWGKNLSLSYIRSYRSSDISFSGLRIDFDKLPGSGRLEVFSPYSKRRGLFYHHNEAGYDGWGIVSYEDDYRYEKATLNTLLDFLYVIGGGGVFNFYVYPRGVEIASFRINGNQEAYQVMYQCLNRLR